MSKPDSTPNNLCMAPWTHTYLSPQTERRMCCASREPAQSFEQYIDTKAGSGEYQPITLEIIKYNRETKEPIFIELTVDTIEKLKSHITPNWVCGGVAE